MNNFLNNLANKPVILYTKYHGKDIGFTRNNDHYYEVFVNSEKCKILNVAPRYIGWHEVFHIMFNHFNIKKDNHTIWNIACDLEINQIIGLTFDPFIYPGKYGLPTGLKAEEYYEILMNQENKHDDSNSDSDSESDENDESKNNESNSKSENEDENDSNNDYDSETDEELKSDKSNEESNNEDENDSNNSDSKIDENEESEDDSNNEFENKEALSEIKKDIKEDKVYFNENNEGFNEGETIFVDVTTIHNLTKEVNNNLPSVYNNLIKDVTKALSKRIELSPNSFKSDYMKFNNRRNSGDIILPGRRRVSGGYRKNFNNNPVVFIDVSGSTTNSLRNSILGYPEIDTINDALNVIAKELHNRYNSKIVFYDSDICKVYLPTDNFAAIEAEGGTNITRTVMSAIKQGILNEDDIVVVITDGKDNFEIIKENYQHIIYEVNSSDAKLISRKVNF